MQIGLSAQSSFNSPSFKGTSTFTIQPVRVRFTFLDMDNVKKDYPKLFENYGGYDALSGIMFEPFTNPIPQNNETFEDNLLKNYNFAKPLFPNMRQVPLLNEIAYILSFPSVNVQDPRKIDLNQTEYYYFLPINLWNTAHQNALPDPLIEFDSQESPSNKNQSYSNAQAGASNNTIDEDDSIDINLGNTFEDKSDIQNLQPYEGDIIYEGRWGQSMRFGSTVLGQNPWSNTGANGDPIFILRNGQTPSQDNPWVPINENINSDLGSVYITSTQQIPIEVASSTYNSYPSDPPQTPNQYDKNQIILNSGRLLFNSNNDHILLTSGKSVNINAYTSFNVDTDNVYIQSSKIYLGDKDADEPLLLGNQTVDVLDELINTLKSFMTICESLVGVPPGAPVVPINSIAVTVKNSLTTIQRDLESIKSKDNFTI
jgi:hypothetical protein